MESFVAQVAQATRAIDARCENIVYGHLGDGNLHLIVHQPPDRPETAHAIESAVYAIVGACHGSISAEHGIGLSKREFLPHSRTPQELAWMRALKNTLDAKHILNRGRVLEFPPG
jgi:FAD/FMN-containing dehydrogenase